jgi:hypothetical protein
MICPVTDRECRTNGCGEKCYKRDSLGYSTISKHPIHADIDKEFEKELYKLINAYVSKGLNKSDLVRKMEYVTQSCRVS